MGVGGPDQIEHDLDNIFAMFDPAKFLLTGQRGGIGGENIKDGSIGPDHITAVPGDKVEGRVPKANEAISAETADTAGTAESANEAAYAEQSGVAISAQSLNGGNWVVAAEGSVTQSHSQSIPHVPLDSGAGYLVSLWVASSYKQVVYESLRYEIAFSASGSASLVLHPLSLDDEEPADYITVGYRVLAWKEG